MDDPVPSSQPLAALETPESGLQFPESVAGFPFGIEPSTFQELCVRAGGQSLIIEDKDPVAISCDRQVVPLPFRTALVLALFCDAGRACEYLVALDEPHRAAPEIRATLERRHGPAAETTAHRACVLTRRLMWSDSEGRMLRMLQDCDPDGIRLIYDTYAGSKFRSRQGLAESENY